MCGVVVMYKNVCRYIVATQLLSALSTLHTHGYAHADLQPRNILVTQDALDGKFFDREDLFSVVLADLGSVRRLTKPVHEPQGTLYYMAPEYFALYDRAKGSGGVPVTPAMDVWSFGIILSEMLLGQLLYGVVKNQERLKMLHQQQVFTDCIVSRLKRPGLVRNHLKKYIDVVKICLAYDPAKRPTPQRLLRLLETHRAFDIDRNQMLEEVRGRFVAPQPIVLPPALVVRLNLPVT